MKPGMPKIIDPNELHGVAALAVAEVEHMGKMKGERDTEFVKRIACAYLNACGHLNLLPVRVSK